jgi:PAS domain S-box-containing protein
MTHRQAVAALELVPRRAEVDQGRENEVSRLSLETKLRQLWDADVLGIVNTTIEGRILDANDTFLRLIGYARVELEAGLLTWQGLIPPDHAEAAEATQVDLVRDGRVPSTETELFHKDGRRVPVLAGAAMLPDGGDAECMAFVHDLTTRKELEAQLRQSQRLESVGLLAGGIAHDLNNVLSAVILYGDCVKSALPEGHPALGDVDEIHRAAQSARNITHQLLAFTRQQVLRPLVIEVGGVILGLEQMLRRLVGDDIQVTVDTSASRLVHADLGQLEQVVLNLVVNARDAMPDGGTLTIDTRDLDVTREAPRQGLPAGRYVEIRVTDSGTGMEPTVLDRIFEPFFTTKEKGRGTGLGLSTVFGIAKQSGGGVWAESVPGEGSTFHVAVPALKSAFTRIRRTSVGPIRSAEVLDEARSPE